jgi:enamine deaminase RidA (YjgF/YER057c/UK114 family)
MPADDRLRELGLTLPDAMRLPPGLSVPFQWVRVRGDRAYISGHGALSADGSPAGPFGKVPSEVPLEAAQESARLATLAIFASLKRELGFLDRVTAWLSVQGFVNADAAYAQTTAVVNPFSELVVSVYGPEVGAHARTAIGVAALPLNLPVVIAAEVEIAA